MTSSKTVRVLASIGRDGELLVQALQQFNLEAECLAHAAHMLEVVRSGEVGALLVTSDALTPAAIAELADVLDEQPKWSDLPLLVMVPGGSGSQVIERIEATLGALPNVALLERPIRPATLASVVRNAVKNRSRQYQVMQNLEEQERTALALLESEKLAVVGRLASSIAHEINNPLESVTNLLYLLREERQLSPEGREYLETAERELARVSQIASQTLRFHRQSTAATLVRPEVLLEEVLNVYKTRLLSSKITVLRDFQPGVSARCFEGDIRQVLSNLIGNAFDVMRTGGCLRLRTRKATGWSMGEPGIAVTVSDSGTGMTPAIQERVFEAFYSTKGIQGTGLGLWISKRIVEKHRGHLRLRSSAGTRHGTVFRLWLPLGLATTAAEAWHEGAA